MSTLADADGVAALLATLLERSPRSTAELAGAVGAGTVDQLASWLSVLEHRGLVSLDAERTSARPGPVALRFARSGIGTTDLVEQARPSLRRVADESGETVNLILPRPGGTEAIAQVDGSYLLGVVNWVGRPLGLHTTAAGKVFLAFGVAQLGDGGGGVLEALTPATITDRATLATELELVRERGYAMIVDELEPGLSAVAAPVRQADGEVIAVLCVSGASLRLPLERLELLGRVAVEQANEVSARVAAGA